MTDGPGSILATTLWWERNWSLMLLMSGPKPALTLDFLLSAPIQFFCLFFFNCASRSEPGLLLVAARGAIFLALSLLLLLRTKISSFQYL